MIYECDCSRSKYFKGARNIEYGANRCIKTNMQMDRDERELGTWKFSKYLNYFFNIIVCTPQKR